MNSAPGAGPDDSGPRPVDVGVRQLTVIKRRLEADGSLRALSFSYPSLVGSMSDHVRRLIDFAQAHRSERLHFVGHSLGGLVILRALQLTDDLPPGRAVLLGSPLQGSRTAQRLARRAVRQGDARRRAQRGMHRLRRRANGPDGATSA